MENIKLLQTHKHLTFVFTGIVFLIVILIGASFLLANYISENSNQKREIYSQINSISKGISTEEGFLLKYARQKIVNEVREFRAGDIRGEKNNIGPKLSFLVLDADGNLIFKEILQEPQFEEINFEKEKIYKDSETYIYTSDVGNKKVVFYQNIRYSFSDVLGDTLLLVFLSVLLSGVVYFVGYKFVGKALLPVEENMKDMADFIHNAGHELKTPLAVIRGNLQIIQAEKKLDRELVSKTIGQVDSANILIEGLRELSEVGKISQISSINLPKIIEKIVTDIEPLALQKGVSIHGKFPEKFMIEANKEELEILITNIIKNAILYNKKGGEVGISMNKNTLKIEDNGTGISKENKEKIFERLYRVGEVRDSEGLGIGLSLVKKIADNNNWKLSVKSKLGVGTIFEITF